MCCSRNFCCSLLFPCNFFSISLSLVPQICYNHVVWKTHTLTQPTCKLTITPIVKSSVYDEKKSVLERQKKSNSFKGRWGGGGGGGGGGIKAKNKPLVSYPY